ncbi:hypothetical protein Belba_1510 [Belliella baltica DSM 15883]|uniref:Uncharacterized protein n=1 Tax=Belliella baltica (strain DSM 15883 / CIP 108006 / LMG 21964 / BA134) TaxID=866536 RepID=I3Z4F5_BELBD|nr:hypothetical protein Belba_1510 [Belliella baltica DSM 15883]
MKVEVGVISTKNGRLKVEPHHLSITKIENNDSKAKASLSFFIKIIMSNF